ncbi:unnamed protein product, partial [Rotaria magnacalcarata]
MSPTSYSKDFPSMLEYLLYCAALFHLQSTNLYHHHFCLKHWKYLTSTEKKRCNVCRLLREQDSASSSDVRLVSKPLAIGIWEEGQPANNLAMYDRPICAYEADIVWRHIMDDEYENPIDEKGFDVVMNAINNALDESNRYSIKRQILAIIARFSGIDVSIDKVVQLQKTLQKCRNYIKIDYKTHMSNSSTIADHCSVFGLSDSKDNDWNEECDRTHTDKCEDCCLLDHTLAEIEVILKDNDEMTEDIRLRHLTLFNQQQAAHDAALASLDDTS